MAKRILVVDDDMMCLKTVQKYLADEGYEVVGALSGMQAIHIVQEAKVDLLLLDIEMPAMSGFSALEQVRLLPNGKHLPTIFLTGRQDRDTVKCCAAAGAEGYITKPVEKNMLLGQVKEVFLRCPAQQGEQTVLIADQDVEFLKQLKLHLRKHYKVIVVNSGKSAMDYLNKHSADVIVLDDSMREENGESLLKEIRQNWSSLPIVLMSGENIEEVKERCQELSVSAYLSRPVNPEVLLQTLQHLLSKLD